MGNEQPERVRVRTFRDLQIWQKGMEISVELYRLLRTLPKDEQFGLVSQMRRASISLPSNIAEGFRRGGQKEFKRFLYMALGSAAELETQVELCKRLHGLEGEGVEKILSMLNHFQAMTMKYIKGTS